jgi:ketosteroid isomerase-like protein
LTYTQTLRLFETSVGERAFKNVVLASTHFDPSDLQHASRQTELRNSHRYWSGMADHGATVTIHDGTAKSAADIIQPLLDAQPIYRLDVVYDLAERQLPWDQTKVAEALNEDYIAAVERLEEDMRHEKEQLERGGDEGWIEAGKRKVDEMGRKVERGYEYLKRGTSRRFEVVREYVEM